MIYDILIVGGGPAGLTAAIYGRRSGRSVLILEKEGYGGQIAYSPRVENYPGVGSVSGMTLSEEMLGQALGQGADTDVGTVTGLRRGADGIWTAETGEGERFLSRSVILAVGAAHRRLHLPGEEELLGRGVSYCAVCDGDFYKGQEVAVAGGGDTALQEALLLAEICSRVTVIHRREQFRGEAALLRRLRERENVDFCTPYTIEALHESGGQLSSLTLRRATDGEPRELAAAALFVCYGQTPATEPFAALLPLSEGYADCGEDGVTGQAGLFVAGDCRKKAVRQLTTAVGDGANAALSAVRYLEAWA